MSTISDGIPESSDSLLGVCGQQVHSIESGSMCGSSLQWYGVPEALKTYGR